MKLNKKFFCCALLILIITSIFEINAHGHGGGGSGGGYPGQRERDDIEDHTYHTPPP